MGERGIVFLAIRNQTDKERVKIKAQTVIGKAALTTFVLNSVLMQTDGEASKLSAEYVSQIHRNFDMDTSSEFSSFAQNFYRRPNRLRQVYLIMKSAKGQIHSC